MIKIILFTFTITASFVAYSSPGQRGEVNTWYGYKTVDSQVLKRIEEIISLEAELTNALAKIHIEKNQKIKDINEKMADAPIFGKPFITDSIEDYEELREKTENEYDKDEINYTNDIQTQINNEVLKLETALASPNKKSVLSTSHKEKKVILNREMMELHNALINFKIIAVELNNKLAQDTTNSELSLKTYDVLLKLSMFSAYMHDTFIERIDSYYKKLISDSSKQAELDIVVINDEREFLGDDFTDRRIKDLNSIISTNNNALPVLDKFKEKALKKRHMLFLYNKKISALKRVASRASESNMIIAEINRDIEAINIETPEIIEFQYMPNALKEI